MIDRHALEHQKARRSVLSVARNSLLMTTLAPHISWVLWLDADIIETPTTLIQDLTSVNRDLVVANAYQKYTDENGRQQQRAYDFNSWIDSEVALDLASKMDDDDVLFEGTLFFEKRAHSRLCRDSNISHSDGILVRTRTRYSRNHPAGRSWNVSSKILLVLIGSTALMVKANVHRDGATFPAFPFYHLLESEGFAKMARRLGYTCWGLPQYLVGLSQ
jgi:mannan polymerase complexes MNN9 subunit